MHLGKLSMLLLLATMGVGAAGAQIAYDGVILSRPRAWDSYPAHLYDGQNHHSMWWCGTSNVLPKYTDAIFYAQKTGSLGAGGWSTPTEVLNNTQTPWAHNHVCDPTVTTGMFSQGFYGMLWTSDTDGKGTNNAVGAAFSNDGVHWTVNPTPVITPYNGYNGTYGAGAGGVDGEGPYRFSYDDTTMSPTTRLLESTDLIHWTPAPPNVTQLYSAGRGGVNATDISYNRLDQHWYACFQTFDALGNYSGETRVVRSVNANDLAGPWTVIGAFNSTITGNNSNNNPGLGKSVYANLGLYIDAQGWAYVFFGTGPASNVLNWDIGQGRFRPGGAPLSVNVSVSASQRGLLDVTAVGDSATAMGYADSADHYEREETSAANSFETARRLHPQADFGKVHGLDALVDPDTAESPATIEVRGLKAGTSYDVYGRFAAPEDGAPGSYGMRMGLKANGLRWSDRTTAGVTLVRSLGGWQEWKVFLGTMTVSDCRVRLHIEKDLRAMAVWTGMNLEIHPS